MPRAYWKGYLRLSLVTCPIELFPATSQSEKTHFHQINTRTGHRLRQQMVDEETGRPVDSEHKGRGYELSKGKYVEIDQDELKAIQIESTHTVDIDGFVPAVLGALVVSVVSWVLTAFVSDRGRLERMR